MNVRADIAELLRAGLTNTAIAEQTGCHTETVAKTRTALGMPTRRRGPIPAPTPTDLFHARTQPLGHGHLRWTGYTSKVGLPQLRHGGRIHTAYQLAFQIRHGRPPVGRVAPGCEHKGCVAPDCMEDQPMREHNRRTYAAIFGGTQ